MPVPADFRAASEAAEDWLVFVHQVSHFGPAGAVDQLFPLLMPGHIPNNLLDSFNKYVELLNRMRDRFAVVSDGAVTWEIGRGWSAVGRGSHNTWLPTIWNSAHEATTGIARMTLGMLVEPLNGITERGEQAAAAKRLLKSRWKALAMSLEEVASLQARIRRERAKIITSVVESASGGDVSDAVWLGEGRVQVGHKTIALEFQEAEVLGALVELGAATRPDLEQKSKTEDAVRILKKLRQKHRELEPLITLPGKRGKGGYSTTIRPAE